MSSLHILYLFNVLSTNFLSTPVQENQLKASQSGPNMNCKDEFPTLVPSASSSDSRPGLGDRNMPTMANKLASNNGLTVRSGRAYVNDADFPSLSSTVTVEPPQAVQKYGSGKPTG